MNFTCQKCSNPLKLDESLETINSSQLNLLMNKNNKDSPQETFDLNPALFIPPSRWNLYEDAKSSNPFDDSASNSFVLVSDEDDQENEGHVISARIHTLTNIFNTLSTNQEIDHPLCQDCALLLIDNYKLKFDETQREKEYYTNFLKKLRQQDSKIENVDSKLEEAMKEYESLQKQESAKLHELRQLEEHKTELDAQLRDLNREFEDLNKNELTLALKLKNKLNDELQEKLNAYEQAKSLYNTHLNNLDKLRKLNIYDTFFKISSDDTDNYGTINGFRLGHRILLSEINAALGQIVLLLVFLVKRLDVKLKDYRLVPMGSKSSIIKYSSHGDNELEKSKTVLNLYSTNEFTLGKLFNFNKLDVSMIALLDILSLIEYQLVKLDPEIELPYIISPKHDSIGGKSIRVTSNLEWTHSCKFFLTDLKWILTYTAARTG